jgi:hypothetical protein
MKEKIWNYGVPFLISAAGCFVALLLYDMTRKKKAKKLGESEASAQAEK